MKTNFFGQKVPSLREILTERPIKDYLKKRIKIQTQCLGALEAGKLTDVIIESAESYDQEEYEIRAYATLVKEGLFNSIQNNLMLRAFTMFDQVATSIKGPRVLDYGCGNGVIGELVAEEGHEVTLGDVYRNSSSLPFLNLNKENDLEDMFDTVMLLTVLHHCENPILTLKHAIRLVKPGGTIIINESIYGVRDNSMFGKLSFDQQWKTAAFIDHFANRILYDPKEKINIPYNFQTRENWFKTFKEHGLKETDFKSLGIDLPVFPEFHETYILET
jgi:2-polyprenyl-3-methyl-5-hydroxy-6-metoxy-1,4-benzoquinol methylase